MSEVTVSAGSRSLIVLSSYTRVGRPNSETASGSPETSLLCGSLGLRRHLLCPWQVGPCFDSMIRSQVANMAGSCEYIE